METSCCIVHVPFSVHNLSYNAKGTEGTDTSALQGMKTCEKCLAFSMWGSILKVGDSDAAGIAGRC